MSPAPTVASLLARALRLNDAMAAERERWQIRPAPSAPLRVVAEGGVAVLERRVTRRRAAAQAVINRTAYVCLFDDSFSYGLLTASFSAVCNGKSGPTFDGTPAGAAYISVVSILVPTGITNTVRVTTTVANSPYPNSRSVRLRVILDDLTYGPLPDAGPSGSIVLDEEPAQGATLGAQEYFYFNS